MDLIKTAITRPVTVSVGAMLLVMFGLISLGAIDIQLTPNVEQPVVTVQTQWPGRSPEEIVDEITKEQEEVLKNISGLKSMRSDSSQGESIVTLEFFLETDIDRARQEVSDALRRVPDYPVEVEEPVISVSEGRADSAIAWIILDVTPEGRELFPDFDPAVLQDSIEREVKPLLERIDGVAQVNVYGGREREARVLVDMAALAQRDLSPLQLVDALRNENQNVSAGTIDEGKREYRVRLLGQYESGEQVLDTVIAYRDGLPVFVRDVATFDIGYEKRRSFVRSLSAKCVAINAIRQVDGNVVNIMRDMRGRLEFIRQDVLQTLHPELGPHLRLRQVYDETVYIDSAIDLVQKNLLFGGLLASAVLLIFLRSLVSTGVIALAIPISVIGTFLALLATGRTLNVISLAGLAFAVGMVVDNAIVVLENINRHLQAGEPARVAALRATHEVWGAVLASTLTTIAVFVPILTVQEEAGQLFRDISIAIVAAVGLSLIVSVTVIPSACAGLLRTPKEGSGGGWLRDVGGAAARSIGRVLSWCGSGWRGWSLRPAIVVLLTVVSLGGAVSLVPPLDYLPAGNQNLVFGGLAIPPGQSVGQLERIASRIETVMQPFTEVDIRDDAGVATLPPIRHPWTGQEFDPVPVKNFFIAGFGGSVIAGATSQDPETVMPIGALLSGAMIANPDAVGGARQSSIFGRGAGGGGTIDLEVSGTNLSRVAGAAEFMFNAAGRQFGYQSLGTSPSNFDLAQPEWRVALNTRGRELGLTNSDLGPAIRALFDGAFVGDYKLGADTIDLVILPAGGTYADRLEYKERLADIPIATRTGAVVPLEAVVDVLESSSPQSIRRIEELPGITISIQPPSDQPLEAVMSSIREQIVMPAEAAGLIDTSMRVRLSGTAAKLDEVRTALFGIGGPSSGDGRGGGTGRLAAMGVLLLTIVLALVVGVRLRSSSASRMGYGVAGLLVLGLIIGALSWLVGSNPELATARFVWALVVTYLLMCALFESFTLPFVIMFAVPLAVVGGFVGLAIVHAWTMSDPTKAPQQFDVLTMLGFVILIGVVVNNAILIVHQSLNFMKAEGAGKRAASEAIGMAVQTRVRPIFMSTLTSVGGMLPLVLFPGAGSEMYRGLGSVVIGGLLCSTVFTLFLVPLLLGLALDMRSAVAAGLLGRRGAGVTEAGGERGSFVV